MRVRGHEYWRTHIPPGNEKYNFLKLTKNTFFFTKLMYFLTTSTFFNSHQFLTIFLTKYLHFTSVNECCDGGSRPPSGFWKYHGGSAWGLSQHWTVHDGHLDRRRRWFRSALHVFLIIYIEFDNLHFIFLVI